MPFMLAGVVRRQCGGGTGIVRVVMLGMSIVESKARLSGLVRVCCGRSHAVAVKGCGGVDIVFGNLLSGAAEAG